MSYDEDEHVKEVFAHFGLAYYLAGVFEAGLTHALLTMDFLHEQVDEMKRLGPGGFDRAAYEAAFEAFYAAQEAKTLGKLVKRLHELTDIDNALRDLIATAKARRDFLAHHFWRERGVEFARRKGRDKMLTELQEAQHLFQEADRQLTAHMQPFLSRVGMPPDVIEKYVQAQLRSMRDEEEAPA